VRRVPLIALFLGAVLALQPTAVQGQEFVTPGVSPGILVLNRTQARMDEGRIREARLELMQWWDLHSATGPDGELQRALWLRGLLTVDPRIATVDFRRLALEFPEGSYTGQARLRLAQSAHAQGDREGAKELYVALERDFPNTGLRLAARAWLDWYAPGTIRERGAPPASVPSDTVTMPASVVAVELGSFRDLRVARELLARAVSAGLVTRVAQMPDGSHSVRMGRYRTPDEAAEARSRARALGFPARLVPLEPQR
jgi:hypothetical protein